MIKIWVENIKIWVKMIKLWVDIFLTSNYPTCWSALSRGSGRGRKAAREGKAGIAKAADRQGSGDRRAGVNFMKLFSDVILD
jgi:hypothetical protein